LLDPRPPRIVAAAREQESVMRIETLRSITAARLAVIAVGASLRSAAAALSNPRIGLLVVCDERQRAAGVVSKSDIVRHLTSMGVTEAPVMTLMSGNVVSCRPADDLHATWERMQAGRLQNLPVLGTDERPLGVLDIRDALEVLLEHEEYQERLLVNYVAGVGYQ
jgi:CBS domain-containing protein